MSQKEYAEHRKVSQAYISQLIKRGQIPKSVWRWEGKNRVIDVVEADRILERTLDPANRRVKADRVEARQETVERAGMGGMDYNTARTLHEQYRAALRKLEYEERKGLLIPAEQVRKDADFAGRLVKRMVSNWPSRIAALVAAESDHFKCEQILRKECNQLLEEISQEVLK